jgi:hypothetical protein
MFGFPADVYAIAPFDEGAVVGEQTWRLACFVVCIGNQKCVLLGREEF